MGATSSSTCLSCRNCSNLAVLTIACNAGSYDDFTTCRCNAGYYGSGFSCTGCSANYWCVGNASNVCPQNTNSLPLSGTQNDCLCNAGYFGNGSVEATSPCGLCFAGYYCPGGNLNLSVACPTNATSAAGASNVTQCFCPPGFSGANGTNCTLCPPNDYCMSGTLSVCPNNSFAPERSSSIADCRCNAGFYGSSGACTVCPMNAYCPAGSTTYTKQ
jgi:hypothetical protein